MQELQAIQENSISQINGGALMNPLSLKDLIIATTIRKMHIKLQVIGRQC